MTWKRHALFAGFAVSFFLSGFQVRGLLYDDGDAEFHRVVGIADECMDLGEECVRDRDKWRAETLELRDNPEGTQDRIRETCKPVPWQDRDGEPEELWFTDDNGDGWPLYYCPEQESP